MNHYRRLFGAGPPGTLISALLLAVSELLARHFNHLQITSSDALRFTVFILLSLVTLLIIAWSIRSLPPGKRGRTLVTSGAFRYFRHPLYGAFGGIHHIYANDLALQGYRSQRFPDGSVIIFDLL